jgi:RNA polymerase sigma-70 factor (sigma-E family)
MKGRAGSAPPDDLARFYADQYDRVRRTLVLFTGDRQRGEDLAQEVFVRTCQHWQKVRAMDAPGPWVHRVAINLAISDARRGRSERRARDRMRAERPDAATGEPAVADEELAAALAALGDDDRAVVVLRYAADLSVADVAEVLAIPEGTVKTRARRALASLRSSGLEVPADRSVDADATDDIPLAPAPRPLGSGKVVP